MAGFTDALELALLDHIFTDPAFTPASTLYVGLLSGTISDDAGGGLTEQTIGTGSYARVAVTASSFGAATGTAPCTKSNSATITFPTATADWRSAANITQAGLYSASTGGTLYATAALAVPKPVLNGDTASFGAGALVFKLGDPSDTY